MSGSLPRPLLLASLLGLLTAALPARGADPAASLALARQLNDAFASVAGTVTPSVVVLAIAQKPGLDDPMENHPFFEQLPEEWKKRFEERRQEERQRRDRGGEPDFDGEGSGVILRADGHILTNDHVVAEAERIRVKLHDGREFDAEVRGRDPESDLAVIRLLQPPADLRPARFGDSARVRVGEYAIAIGAPYELEYSVTFGHVSAKGRANIPGAAMMDQDFLQTDAEINPGNSGGPLVNIEGEVIGINSMIRGLRTGIGFAIPSNLAREISERLITDGRFRRSWLGISIDSLRENRRARELSPKVRDGVIVTGIMKDGPAAGSGLETMDVITAVDGQPVSTVQQLRNEITRKRPGSEVALEVHRQGSRVQLTVRPGEMPDRSRMVASRRPERPEAARAFGLTVEGLPATEEGGESDPAGPATRPPAGVRVTAVTAESGAGRLGLKEGDIIYEVDKLPVASLEQFRRAATQAAGKEKVRLRYLRDGEKKSDLLNLKSR